MKIVRHKNKGFSLIEMILVLGLSSLAFIGILNYEKRKTENLRAESVGQQFEEVGKALSSYIVREGTSLDTNIPMGTTATIPLTVLQGVSSLPYVGRQYLPTTFSPTSGFGVNYVIQIRNNGGNSLTGMVVSNLPVRDETGQIRYDWIGSALRKAGSQSGSSFFTGTSITGLNGGWNITNAEFPAITTAGQIAYRSQYQNNYDNIYVRRDGAAPMVGDLNMGNFNIGNATNISYNGWLSGNNALLNSLRTGYILNTGNMRNEGNLQVIGQGSFDSIYVQNAANTGSLLNRGNIQNNGNIQNSGSLQNNGNIQNNGNMQNNGNLTVDGTVSPGWAVETWGCVTGTIGKAAYTVADGWAYNGKTLACVSGVWRNTATPPLLSTYNVSNSAGSGGNSADASANCNAGDTMLSGGGTCQNGIGLVALSTSQPNGQGWYAACGDPFERGNVSVNVYAVCKSN